MYARGGGSGNFHLRQTGGVPSVTAGTPQGPKGKSFLRVMLPDNKHLSIDHDTFSSLNFNNYYTMLITDKSMNEGMHK